LSFWLIASARRQRLATAAASALVEWAFTALPELRLVRIDREPTNEATARIARRLGARPVGPITKRIKEADIPLERCELSPPDICS
jgi:RimJ/RimL family protein N-acetyltransferase